MKDIGNIPNYCGDCGVAQGAMFAKDGYVVSNRFCVECGAQIGENPRFLVLSKILDAAARIMELGAVVFLVITCVRLLHSWLQ